MIHGLVPLHTRKKAIDCHFMFVVKFNPDGFAARLKAHFFIKGYTQTFRVNYSNTFSPVAKLTSIALMSPLLLLTIRTCISMISRMSF